MNYKKLTKELQKIYLQKIEGKKAEIGALEHKHVIKRISKI